MASNTSAATFSIVAAAAAVAAAKNTPQERSKRKRERSGEMMTTAEAKKEWLLTPADLKSLESKKVGRSNQYYKEDVEEKALRKHGSYQNIEKKKKEAEASGKVIGGMTIEQHRRILGDHVKSKISVEKYTVSARTHCVLTCLMEVFKELVVPNSDEVVPKEFTEETPVVVASVRRAGAETIFGKTKIMGGNRMQTWYGYKFDLIYYPPTQCLKIWWTMM